MRIEQFNSSQGLYQRHITTIFQDQSRFLWVGTSDGLCRYDGYQFETYRFDPLDATSISGNYIQQITQDRFGKLWITTSGGGINRFDPASQSFHHFHNVDSDSFSLSNDDVTTVFEDSRGQFWIGTNGGGLNWFDPTTERFHQIKYNPTDANSLSSNFVSAFCEDTLGNLWIGTSGGGLNRLPAGTHLDEPNNVKFERFYAQGAIYPATVYRTIFEKIRQNSYLAAIQRPEPGQEQLDFFNVEQPTTALIVSTGNSGPFGMSDYGWLENADEEVIWEMDERQSTFLSGQTKSRIQAQVITLQSGTYRLRYRSGNNGFLPETFDERRLWGIQLFALDSEQIAPMKKQLSERILSNGLPHNWVTALSLDETGNLWIGTANGVAKLVSGNTEGQHFHSFNPLDFGLGNRDDLHISRMAAAHFAGKSGVWVHANEQHLYFIDAAGDDILPIEPPVSGDEKSPVISTFRQEKNQKLWIGTTNKGLFCLNLQKFSPADPHGKSLLFEHFGSGQQLQHSLSDDHVTQLYQDHAGILWIGLAQGGLNKLNRTRQPFVHIRHIAENAQSLSNPVVTAIMEDRDERIWIGTYGGGINILTRDGATPGGFRFSHLRSGKNGLASDFITSLFQDQSGNIWVGTHGAGLAQLRESDDGQVSFLHYRFNPLKSNSISGDFVNTIYEDQYGQLWIGTNSGLNQLDRLTRRFTRYRHNANDPFSLSDNEIWAIYEDSYSQGRSLWIGTRNGGINKFDRQNYSFIRYNREFDNPHSLNNPAVLSIYEDSAGQLWFGTYSGGLNRFDHETQQFTFFTERDGLANNMIFGILEDRENNLWLSTNKGITKFSPQRKSFQNFDANDGLQADEFRAGAYYQTRRGEMLFGGINGVSMFYPDSVRMNPHLPGMQFTQFTVMGEDQTTILNQAAASDEPIELNYQQDIVSFEFAALDFNNPAKNRYAYKLEGLHDDWIDNGNRRFVSFPNLPSGSYVLRVKGSNNDGVWNESGISVKLIVTPPFWQRWWFIALAIIFAGAATLAITNWRIRQKINRLQENEQVRQQENERVRAKAAHDFHDELGHKLTKITLFSEILKRQMNGAAPEVLDYLNRIGDTAKGLTGGMRDFIWTLDPEKDSLYEVIVRLKDFGDELFDKTGISFRMEGLSDSLQDVRMSTDWRRHLTLIFKEAMNNALKHAQCQNVVLRVRFADGVLLITLLDDGRGIPELSGIGADDAGEKSGLSATNSRGNGLRNMNIRAKKIHGKIQILANEPSGMCIEFAAKMP